MADNLSKYREKRDLKKTTEPSGEASVKSSNCRRFAIRKHDATPLHYDLWLELDGVLKSWGSQKGLRSIPMTCAAAMAKSAQTGS